MLNLNKRVNISSYNPVFENAPKSTCQYSNHYLHEWFINQYTNQAMLEQHLWVLAGNKMIFLVPLFFFCSVNELWPTLPVFYFNGMIWCFWNGEDALYKQIGTCRHDVPSVHANCLLHFECMDALIKLCRNAVLMLSHKWRHWFQSFTDWFHIFYWFPCLLPCVDEAPHKMTLNAVLLMWFLSSCTIAWLKDSVQKALDIILQTVVSKLSL